MSIIKKHLPDTYYAGLNDEERLKMLVDHWQRLVETNQMLEKKIQDAQLNVFQWLKHNVAFDNEQDRTKFLMDLFEEL